MDMTTLLNAADWTGITAAVGIAVSLVMQPLKALIETIPPFDPANVRAYRDEAHNAILRLISGALIYLGVLLIAVQVQPLTSQLAVAVLGLAFPGSGLSFLSFKTGQKLSAKVAASPPVVPTAPVVPPLPSDATPILASTPVIPPAS